MGKIQGSKVYISLGGTTIEGVTSSSFNEVVEAIDATTQDSSNKKEYVAGDYDADFTVDGAFDATHTYGETQLRTALNARAAVAFVWGDGIETPGAQVLSGNALLTSLSVSGGEGSSIKTWSVGLKVTGGTTEGTSATTIA